MTSISNSHPALLPIHFTSQKLIRSKHRKGVPGIMVILMPGALLQDTPDALLVLYQTETFKTEKTVTTIWKTHLSTATIITRQNCNLLPIPGHSGTKSTEKAEKSQEKEPETSRFRPLCETTTKSMHGAIFFKIGAGFISSRYSHPLAMMGVDSNRYLPGCQHHACNESM